MYCNHCKTQIDDDAAFCPNCGETVIPAGIRLSCENCGAVLTPEKNEEIMTCPYCGSKHLFRESDQVKIARMNAAAEKERLRTEKKQQENAEIRKAAEKYRKSFRRYWTILCMIVCFLMGIVSIDNGYTAAGIIAFIQTGLFFLSWLLGMQIIPEKRPQLRRIPMYMAYALTLVFCLCWSGEFLDIETNDPWPTGALADRIPQPEGNHTYDVSLNDQSWLSVKVKNIDADGSNRYIEQCRAMGFTEDPELNEAFTGMDPDGYVLEITQYGNIKKMNVRLQAPVHMTAFSWTTNPAFAIAPVPESQTGVIMYEYRDMYEVMLGDTDHTAYDAYVQKCMDAGFNREYSRTRNAFYGYTEAGDWIKTEYVGFNRMSIELKLADKIEKTE